MRGATLPRVGLAYGPGTVEFIGTHPGQVDYIEIPFEQLRHAPALAALSHVAPLILHCASLSIGGFVPPRADVVDAVAEQARSTGTPWVGEHLAFIAADALDAEPGAATTLSYTVCPQLSEQTVERVAENLAALRPRLPVPLILENSPQYFAVPGSTMGMITALRC